MQIAKWGNSLAVRLPKALVEKLGLKEGDRVEISDGGKKTLIVEQEGQREREEALKALRSMRWKIPADYKFDREEAHERGWRFDESDERH
ncbi:MAG TPA: AbrB/MazE/SpoVT family DNA-binding domain-containing protein [Rhizomicrobium sp.]